VLFRRRNYLNDIFFGMVSVTILIVFVIPSIPQGKACFYQSMFILIPKLLQTVIGFKIIIVFRFQFHSILLLLTGSKNCGAKCHHDYYKERKVRYKAKQNLT